MDQTIASIAGRPGERLRPLRRLLRTIAASRSRRRLLELDDHLLRDLGLTRDQARREAERPSWDAPGHWLR